MDAGEQILPDEVIVGMITVRVADGDARDAFLLDGFRRNGSRRTRPGMRCAGSIGV